VNPGFCENMDVTRVSRTTRKIFAYHRLGTTALESQSRLYKRWVIAYASLK